MNIKVILFFIIFISIALPLLGDACDGTALFYIWNDTLHSVGSYPQPGIDDLSGCPSDLYMGLSSDTMYQIYYPDTLVWADTIAAYLPDSIAIMGTGWYNSQGISAEVWIPPDYDCECCKDGIYAKARMFDDASGTYSPWVDVNTTDMFIGSYLPPYGYVLQVSLSNFKSRELGWAMGFDCDVDSLILFVWDCNNADRAGTAGEFGVWYGTFPDEPSLYENSINLSGYGYDYHSGLELALERGWNLISIPSSTGHPASIFGIAAYGYDPTASDYYTPASLDPSKGYFALSMATDTIDLATGLTTYSDTLYRGWNLIGALDHAVPSSHLITSPPGLWIPPIFGWNGMDYFAADIIYPGGGYWILSTGNGRITIEP